MAVPFWLPTYQHHVLYTLGQVDAHIDQAVRLIIDYSRSDPLEFKTEVDGSHNVVRVVSVAPLPEAIGRYFADALGQLRSAVEHVLFAEVSHQAQHPLTRGEEQAVEMPAVSTMELLGSWANHRARQTVAPLQKGGALWERISALQPFHDGDPTQHPLRRLVEFTNAAKHRSPSAAATMLSLVEEVTGLDRAAVSGEGDRPVRVGDEIARYPVGMRRELNIWAPVWIQRPLNRGWVIAANELRDLELWVRLVAIPTLVTGEQQPVTLPPGLDITIAYDSIEDASQAAHTLSAHQRSLQGISAEMTRDALPRLIVRAGALLPIERRVSLGETRRWLRSLPDERAIAAFDSLDVGPESSVTSFLFALRVGELVSEVRKHADSVDASRRSHGR